MSVFQIQTSQHTFNISPTHVLVVFLLGGFNVIFSADFYVGLTAGSAFPGERQVDTFTAILNIYTICKFNTRIRNWRTKTIKIYNNTIKLNGQGWGSFTRIVCIYL